MRRSLVGLVLVIVLVVVGSANALSTLPINTIQLPQGFKIEVYAGGILVPAR